VAAVAAVAPKLRHEEFCLPRPDAEEPRVETFRSFTDDPATGRSRPTHTVHRCLECGAASYQQIGA
jgi:hypothetical protein